MGFKLFNKKRYILLLPFTMIILFITLLVSMFIPAIPNYVVVYIAILFIISIFTAYQSVFIQQSMNYDIEDMDETDTHELMFIIAKDFSIYFSLHSLVVTVIYFAIYWIYSLI